MRAGLFPGQGIDARRVLDGLSGDTYPGAHVRSVIGFDLKSRVQQAARDARPTLSTAVAQPAIFVAGVMAYQAALDRGERFDYLLGHSLGEYTALVCAGAISFTQGLRLVAARATAMQRAASASTGGMVAVRKLQRTDVDRVAATTNLTVANDNSPTQLVLSGDRNALAQAASEVHALGGRAVMLAVDGAFHSDAMRPAVDELTEVLYETEVRCPRIPVISNVTASHYRAPGEIRKLLVHQLTHPVRFRDCLLTLQNRGVRNFIDLGPGRVVGRLAEETTGEGALVRV